MHEPRAGTSPRRGIRQTPLAGKGGRSCRPPEPPSCVVFLIGVPIFAQVRRRCADRLAFDAVSSRADRGEPHPSGAVARHASPTIDAAKGSHPFCSRWPVHAAPHRAQARVTEQLTARRYRCEVIAHLRQDGWTGRPSPADGRAMGFAPDIQPLSSIAARTWRTMSSVLITGCSSGIGHDAAHGLEARGWRVFATCRKPEDCAACAARGWKAPRSTRRRGQHRRRA